MRYPGEVLVLVDAEGKLLALHAVPLPAAAALPQAVHWETFFSAAGLDISKWSPSTSQETPNFYADSRVAWSGAAVDKPGTMVGIEAASYLGRPTRFAMISRATEVPNTGQGSLSSVGGTSPTFLAPVYALLAFLALPWIFARRNLRLGRGDRKGARLLVTANVIHMVTFWVWSATHSLVGDIAWLSHYMSIVIVVSATIWASYIALEPFVRRQWPKILTAWVRLLSGQWRDSLIGRDILVGSAFGVGLSLMYGVAEIRFFTPEASMDFRSFVMTIQGVVGPGVGAAIVMLCTLFVLRLILRNDKLAAVTLVLVVTRMNLGSNRLQVTEVLVVLAINVLSTFILMRFGLLTLVVAMVANGILVSFPPTLQTSLWYSPASYGSLAVIAALAFYGFRTSLAGRRLIDALSENQFASPN